MIKVIILGKRKEGMSPAEFRYYSVNKHSPRVKSVPEFWRHVRKEVVNYIIEDEGTSFFGSAVQYDSVAQLWFDSVEDAKKAFAEPAYMEVIRPDELNFANLEDSVILLAVEHQLGGSGGQP